VSKLRCTNLIFIEPGAKINGQYWYYRDVLLMQNVLPAIPQQDSAPAHRARDTVELLWSTWDTPRSSVLTCGHWPANSPDLNPVDYLSGAYCKCVKYTNPRYGRVAEASLATWAEFQHSVLARPFVKRFALCYRSVVLSVCPVCDVDVLWTNGWTDQDETWRAGRPRPWPHCVRWGPSCPSPKRAQPPPIFGLSDC